MRLLTGAALPASRGTFSLEWIHPSCMITKQHMQTLAFICAAFSSFSHMVIHLLTGAALPASRNLFFPRMDLFLWSQKLLDPFIKLLYHCEHCLLLYGLSTRFPWMHPSFFIIRKAAFCVCVCACSCILALMTARDCRSLMTVNI